MSSENWSGERWLTKGDALIQRCLADAWRGDVGSPLRRVRGALLREREPDRRAQGRALLVYLLVNAEGSATSQQCVNGRLPITEFGMHPKPHGVLDKGGAPV